MIRLADQGKIRQNAPIITDYRQLTTNIAEVRMADESDIEKAGEIRFTPSVSLWKYLGWLSLNTVLGKTENEVARQVLTERLAQMRQENYRDGKNSSSQ
jgi:hypothetical protein